MRWRPIGKVISGLLAPPYLLPETDRDEITRRVRGQGFDVRHVDAADLRPGDEISLTIGKELDFPSFFKGGWDEFFDLLTSEFQVSPRRTIVSLLNADVLASRDLRLFVNTSWQLQNATETIESEGEGDWQLEFFYWGEWRSRVGDSHQ